MQRQNYSFVVRVWLEGTYDDGKIAIWRGSIEKVGGDSRLYFSDLDGITHYIQMQIGLKSPPSPARWRLALERTQNGIQNAWKYFFGKNP